MFPARPGRARGFGDKSGYGRSGACADALAVHHDFRKHWLAKAKDQPFHPFVADDQIAAAAKDAKRDALLIAALHQSGQFLVGARLCEHLGGAAQLQIGVRRQRFVALEDIFKLGETGHGVLQTGGRTDAIIGRAAEARQRAIWSAPSDLAGRRLSLVGENPGFPKTNRCAVIQFRCGSAASARRRVRGKEPVMSSQRLEEAPAEARRKEIFMALVEAQDQEVGVARSRRLIAERFSVTELLGARRSKKKG